MKKPRMTAKRWLEATDPGPLLKYLGDDASHRKQRLVAVAACRSFGPLVSRKAVRTSLDIAERFADGEGTAAQRAAAWERADEAASELDNQKGSVAEAVALACEEPDLFDLVVVYDVLDCAPPTDRAKFRELFADLLRDIFGNPFRPVAFDPAWRTSTAVALAQQMYDSRDFGVMPILGDALQDAGCEHADVLDHCRGPGPHVRGCWVVDLVLGKR
jgi:hypothetical protein